jgi:hypothetical protein
LFILFYIFFWLRNIFNVLFIFSLNFWNSFGFICKFSKVKGFKLNSERNKLPLVLLASPPVVEPDWAGPNRPSRFSPSLSLSHATLTPVLSRRGWRFASPPQSPPRSGQLQPPLASPLVVVASPCDALHSYPWLSEARRLLLWIASSQHLGFQPVVVFFVYLTPLDEMVMLVGALVVRCSTGTCLVAVWRHRDRAMPPCRHGRCSSLHQVHISRLLYSPLLSLLPLSSLYRPSQLLHLYCPLAMQCYF